MSNTDPNAATTADHHHVHLRHGTFELRGVHELRCAGAVERALREQPHVTDVRLDWKNDLVHVGYDPANIGPEDIEQVITQTGCDCKPTEIGEEHPHEAMAPPQRRMQHVGHGVDTQPMSITATTRITICPTPTWQRPWNATCATGSSSLWSSPFRRCSTRPLG